MSIGALASVASAFAGASAAASALGTSTAGQPVVPPRHPHPASSANESAATPSVTADSTTNLGGQVNTTA